MFYVVTINGEFTACIQFDTIMEVGENLYISTHDGNEAHKQIIANGNMQIIAKSKEQENC